MQHFKQVSLASERFIYSIIITIKDSQIYIFNNVITITALIDNTLYSIIMQSLSLLLDSNDQVSITSVTKLFY